MEEGVTLRERCACDWLRAAPARGGIPYRLWSYKVVCACGASTSRTLRRGSRSVEVEEADDLPQHLRLVTRVEEQI